MGEPVPSPDPRGKAAEGEAPSDDLFEIRQTFYMNHPELPAQEVDFEVPILRVTAIALQNA